MSINFQIFFIISLVFLVVVLGWIMPKLWFFHIITLLPASVCFIRALTVRGWDLKLMPLAVVATTVFGQLPTVIGSASTAICIIAFSLSTVPSSRKISSLRSKGSPFRVLAATLGLVIILLTDNFMVWVVSATFKPGQRSVTAPPPLQDNGQRIMKELTSELKKSEVVGLRRLWNAQGALVACLGVSFVLAEIFERRQLYAFALRGVSTMACARVIRTISYLVTVMPSQNIRCYAEHFPYPPPNGWLEWIWVGIIPAANGGCNDLIVSGHATVTSTMACLATSISNDAVFGAALWALVILDYTVEIYEGFHYSVDMFLGMVISCLLWRVLEVLERTKFSSQNKDDSSKKETASDIEKERKIWSFGNLLSNQFLSKQFTLLVYGAPTLLAFLQVVLLPQWIGNILVVLYTGITAVLYLGYSIPNKDPATAAFFQHLAQHIIYSLLYLTLGIYL